MQPQALLFVGVAGGLKGDIKIGDVVVASKVYGIHGGKDARQGFLVRPEAWRPSHRLEQAARHALRGKAHFKPIAVGYVVIADAASAIACHLEEHYNDAVAIEMEGAGVAQAAHLTGTLDALIIRGISDNADARKHERDAAGSQSDAARNAAQAAVALWRELVVAPNVGQPDGSSDTVGVGIAVCVSSQGDSVSLRLPPRDPAALAGLRFPSHGDRQGEAMALPNLGSAPHGAGRSNTAIDAYTWATDLFRAVDDRAGEAMALGNLGGLLTGMGRYREAIAPSPGPPNSSTRSATRTAKQGR
ncbi:5'-methylthioadenosine/S-adenosylhomocysteine nucleosidase [Streptomyces sp. NPDC000658]|uniref:5'-methylthioadenosine/S-adenosylhomocysteine nucleosidase n=1 Tax=Streptomyces sp. NPDC000658 TaxID=3154266 RepID=UPI00331C31BA